VTQILGQVQTDYINILGDIRARHPNADLYAIGYHNPYNEFPSLPIAGVADEAVRGLNQVIAGVAPVFGARYVNFYDAINPDEATLTLISTIGTDPVNFVHLTDAGYAVASQELIATAAVPAPPGVLLPAFALVIPVARRLRGGRAAARLCSVTALRSQEIAVLYVPLRTARGFRAVSV